MCNVTILLKLICLTCTVVNAVNGNTFILNMTRERRGVEKYANNDCPNSSDFVCTSGECIREDKECNGAVDCPDASDESYSCHRFRCPWGMFRCKYGACIYSDLECDGKQDCRDNSDETSPNCKNSFPHLAQTCRETQFRCDSGECIDIDLKCDGKKNCKDNSDETRNTCWSMRCPGFSYVCKYGACVDGAAECNGVTDCFDGSDEDPEICKNTGMPASPHMEETSSGSCCSTKSCILPEHPGFGQWSVYGSSGSFGPGSTVSSGIALKITCNSGYKLDGLVFIVCEEGRWSAPVGHCAKNHERMY